MAETNTTIIAPGTIVKGEMTFENVAHIEGKFEGKITAKGELRVAESAVCAAEVTAGSIVVDGRIEGNLTAADRIQLNAKARLQGDIVAKKLVMAEGACIEGHVSVGAGASEAAPRTTGSGTGPRLAEQGAAASGGADAAARKKA